MSRQISFKRLRRSSGIGKYAAGSAPPVCIHSIHDMYIMYTRYTKHVYTAVIHSFTLYIMYLYMCVYKCTQHVYTMYNRYNTCCLHCKPCTIYMDICCVYAVYIYSVCALCIKPLSSYYLLLYIYYYVYHQFYM